MTNCEHCNRKAVRTRVRSSGPGRPVPPVESIPLCDEMICLRREWTIEDNYRMAAEINKRLGGNSVSGRE